MYRIKEEMKNVLEDLINNHGLIAIKAEFEAEGSRLDELIMLNEVVMRNNTDMIVKIGGCEAMRDIDQCKLLGAKGIMAPMIETSFAMSKFRNAAETKFKDDLANVEWVINAETKTCYENFDSILDVADGFVNTVVVGRSDLSASMGISRNDIDGKEVFNVVKNICKKAKDVGIKASFGGGVSVDTIPFILDLGDVIDQYETRKVVLKKPADFNEAERQIMKALEFEMLYLKYKRLFYSQMAKEDDKRISALEERLKVNGAKFR